SIWFKKGWTLQELLLPRTVLFYTRHWTLYRPSSIHKEDRVILSGLERESGVSLSHLANFYSGMMGATRSATLPEDMACSLFGIFNLHFLVLCGE
ncbi:hypothetical protein EDD17DRAFT_1427819, partial [Pisolithus thermaeus]